MLMLARNIGQKIMIGDDIVITFGGSNSMKQGRIGIQAPPHVRILREELLDADLPTESVDKPVENTATASIHVLKKA